jgi:DinB superfamily
MARCEQCGFDYEDQDPSAVPGALQAIARAFHTTLVATDPAVLRRRPGPDVWSGLEYACHVRDVFLVQRDRLYSALVEDTPNIGRMHRDERVVLARYNSQDPSAVAKELVMAADLAAAAFSDLDGEQRRRRLIYNWPTRQEKDVTWLIVHTLHEGRHHLGDCAAVVAGRTPAEP